MAGNASVIRSRRGTWKNTIMTMSMSTAATMTTTTAPAAIATIIGTEQIKKPAEGGFLNSHGLQLISAHAEEPDQQALRGAAQLSGKRHTADSLLLVDCVFECLASRELDRLCCRNLDGF